MVFEPEFKGGGVEAADSTVDFGAVVIDDGSRDALDTGGVGGFGSLVDVGLVEMEIIVSRVGDLVVGELDENRAKMLAVSAPRSEIFNDGETGLLNFGLAVVVSELFEFFHKNGLSKLLVKHE